MTYEISVYDHTTGENIVREMTDNEKKEYEAQIAISNAEKAAKEAAAAEAVAAKEAAVAKLAALGLDLEDLKALGL